MDVAILPSPVEEPPPGHWVTAEATAVGGGGATYRIDVWWGRTEEPDGLLVPFLRAAWLTLRAVGRQLDDWVIFRGEPVSDEDLWDGASVTIRDLEELH